MKRSTAKANPLLPALAGYSSLVGGIAELLETARRTSARAVNALMTATYWEIGRRIVEFEQGGEKRAAYGRQLMARLSQDLGRQYGRGFSPDNLESMRQFYCAFPPFVISETVSRKSESRPRVATTPHVVPYQATPPLEFAKPAMTQKLSAQLAAEIRHTRPGKSAVLPTSSTPSNLSLPPLSQFNLRDVASAFPLPTGIWYSPGVKANVLFFDKKPAAKTPWTKELWIYDLRTNKNFTLRTKQIADEDVKEFVEVYQTANRLKKRVESERFKRFTYGDLMARDKANVLKAICLTKAK